MFKQTITLSLIFVTISSASGYYVQIRDDGPIVKGATIHFYVTLYDGGYPATGRYKYEWEDNAIPQNTRESDIQNATDTWTVTYNRNPMGLYLVQVSVKSCVLSVLCYEIGSARSEFNITGTLNGEMRLSQKNQTLEHDFVSNKETVTHEIVLKESDREYISHAPTVLTYWFVDCTYYGFTSDFKFRFNYTNPDEEHVVDALIMADFTPPPPTTTVAPSTTTTPTSTTKPTTTLTPITTPTTKATTSTTTKPSNVTTAVILSTGKPDVTSATTAVRNLVRRSIQNATKVVNGTIPKVMTKVDGKFVSSNLSLPYVCNGTHVMTDSKNVYGFFYKRVKVKAPVSNVNVTGNNWIQHGDLLSLQVSCRGSENIQYCVELIRGAYNVTGNETCHIYMDLENCKFPIKRYLSDIKYTVLIIIKNEINKIVTPIAVTIYEVKKQAQLSVIVVPVAFSLVAVVLIVFGVAYYIQNRSRFVIEVADFNFGQQYTDMEYKTFKERLRDSITNAFTRGPSPGSSEVPVWPPGRK